MEPEEFNVNVYNEQIYIGCKIVKGMPMSLLDYDIITKRFNKFLTREQTNEKYGDDGRPGYRVTYVNGYISWSPKKTFEDAYRIISEFEKSLII